MLDSVAYTENQATDIAKVLVDGIITLERQ